MGRTNIEIDEELIARVMQRYGLRTKREAVDLALRRAAGEAMSREEALAMEGTGWEGDLAGMRADRIDATWSADDESDGEDRP
jgi:Arc/MetJ family transcription regulator